MSETSPSPVPEPRVSEALEEHAPPPWRTPLFTWVRDFLAAGLAVLFVGVFLVQPFRVDGRSMEPLLFDGQRILVNKLAYRIGDISRGDVVIVSSPAGQTLVKRVVGLPGDELSIFRGVVSIDGQALDQSYVEESRRTEESVAPFLLTADQYFLLGDHRAVSHDSRVFGVVRRDAIRGRASFRYWPPGQWGRLRECARELKGGRSPAKIPRPHPSK